MKRLVLAIVILLAASGAWAQEEEWCNPEATLHAEMMVPFFAGNECDLIRAVVEYCDAAGVDVVYMGIHELGEILPYDCNAFRMMIEEPVKEEVPPYKTDRQI